jgi:hypothetical protein
VDTSETLAAELIYQVCCPDKEYAEFLDLPLSVWRFSVDYKFHGKTVKTGWSSKPSKLFDRKNEDNNILFETWTSNVAKMDMNEDSCIALRDDIKNVQIAHPHLCVQLP